MCVCVHVSVYMVIGILLYFIYIYMAPPTSQPKHDPKLQPKIQAQNVHNLLQIPVKTTKR